MLARALGFNFRARLAKRLLYKMISASVSALRPRGMTLKGWPALGDVNCNVERRRSWTGFKLLRQRARAARPALEIPTLTAALSGPDTGRPGPLADPQRRARNTTGRPKGESQREPSPPAGLDPHAVVSRPGLL